MNENSSKLAGILCLVVCAVCLFVAVERYNANANNVQAMNQMQQSPMFGGMMSGAHMEPATPASTKYALLFAALTGIGGAVLLARSRKTVS